MAIGKVWLGMRELRRRIWEDDFSEDGDRRSRLRLNNNFGGQAEVSVGALLCIFIEKLVQDCASVLYGFSG